MTARRTTVSTAAVIALSALTALLLFPPPAGGQADDEAVMPADADVAAAGTQPASTQPAMPSGEVTGDDKADAVKKAVDSALGGEKADLGEVAEPGLAEKLSREKVASAWNDFLHYVRIGQVQAARSYGQALVDSGADPKTIYEYSLSAEDTHRVLDRGEKLSGLKPTIVAIRKMIEEGYFKLRQDPAEIRRAIDMLPKSVQAYEIAARRLIISGEYAMPQMSQKLMDPKLPALHRERLITILPRMGKQVVLPLSTALQTTNTNLQGIYADALGRIQYPHAGPRLRELHDRKDLLKRVRETVESALLSCVGPAGLKKSIAEMYYDLALKYYYQAESLRSDERVSKANVWYWREDTGLVFKPVPREIFCDVYAMRMSRMALAHDPNFYPAVSLWLATYLNREIHLPAGADDPLLAADEMPAAFYLQAASARYQQAVLQRTLRDYNTPALLAAMNALVKTNGAKNMIRTHQGAQPLVEAMSYPDRNVRFLAAESLALALPDEAFQGFGTVLPVLNEAIRQTGKRRAMVVVTDQEARNVLKDAVRAAGYEVLENPDPVKALSDVRRVGGVDVFVVATDPGPEAVLVLLRREGRFVATPVIAAVEATETRRALAKRDKRMVLTGHKPDKDAIATALADAAKLAAGKPLTAAEAEAWAVRAAKAAKGLAVTGNKVLDFARCRPPLIEALGSSPAVQTAAADALSVFKDASAQRAIADLANGDNTGAEVRIAAYKSATASVRRFGNQLTEAQARQVVSVVVTQGPAAIRQAASLLLGAMDLPSEKIKPLILTAETMD